SVVISSSASTSTSVSSPAFYGNITSHTVPPNPITTARTPGKPPANFPITQGTTIANTSVSAFSSTTTLAVPPESQSETAGITTDSEGETTSTVIPTPDGQGTPGKPRGGNQPPSNPDGGVVTSYQTGPNGETTGTAEVPPPTAAYETTLISGSNTVVTTITPPSNPKGNNQPPSNPDGGVATSYQTGPNGETT
ncbi:hypothetical protein C6P41_003071, partial [Kluyveromyces marxianus]